MVAVAIVRESEGTDQQVRYRAIAGGGKAQSVGKTAGEALDALTAQLGESENGTLVVIQQMQPDEFFTAAQMDRLQALMLRSCEQDSPLTSAEQAELEALIEAEILASARRAATLANALGR